MAQLTPDEAKAIREAAEIMTRGRTDGIRTVIVAMMLDVAHNATQYDSYGYWANSLRALGRTLVEMASYADGARRGARNP